MSCKLVGDVPPDFQRLVALERVERAAVGGDVAAAFHPFLAHRRTEGRHRFALGPGAGRDIVGVEVRRVGALECVETLAARAECRARAVLGLARLAGLGAQKRHSGQQRSPRAGRDVVGVHFEVLGLVGVEPSARLVVGQPGTLVPLGLRPGRRVGQGLPRPGRHVEAVELGLVALEQVDVVGVAGDVDQVGAALDLLVRQPERHIGELGPGGVGGRVFPEPGRVVALGGVHGAVAVGADGRALVRALVFRSQRHTGQRGPGTGHRTPGEEVGRLVALEHEEFSTRGVPGDRAAFLHGAARWRQRHLRDLEPAGRQRRVHDRERAGRGIVGRDQVAREDGVGRHRVVAGRLRGPAQSE